MARTFNKDDLVRLSDGREGIVRYPQEAGDHYVSVVVNGKVRSRSFHASELTKIEVFTQPVPVAPVAATPSAEVTLEQLIKIRDGIRRDLAALDQQIMGARIAADLMERLDEHFRASFSQLNSLQPVYAASDAEKIKLDTARATAAAKRLFPGKL